jgi:phosphatidate cytidylyltransferase
MGPRVLTVLVTLPLAVGLVWVGGIALALCVVAVAVVASGEYQRLARSAGAQPSMIVTAAAVVYPLLAATGRWSWAVPVLVVAVFAASIAAMSGDRRGRALTNAAVDILGALYAGVLPAYLVLARADAGTAATLAILSIVWINDIAAYVVGALWGRHKLVPAISPGKSVEGLAAGLAGAVAAGIVIARSLDRPVPALALVAFAVALSAVAGDLWESAMKRAAGVKDSGALLPGHGGLLDRIDAVLFGVPVGYYLWRWLV